MRLRSLRVRQVLHYDEFSLEFNNEASFHVFYGPNETGKSTLLSVIVDLLFGGPIPEALRAHYDSRSRLQGIVERGDDAIYHIERKKRYNRLVLSDPSHPELPEDVLWPFIGGYPRDRYMMLFGFDHDRLRAGGQSLLESQGNVGISLFEAGGGIQYLTKILQQLSQRSEQLLDPSFNARSAKELNKQWRAFTEAQKRIRQYSLRAEEWHRVRDEVAQHEGHLQHLQQQWQEAQAQLHKVERLIRVRPFLIEWQEHIKAMAGKAVPKTSPDVEDYIRQQFEVLDTTQSRLSQLHDEYQRQQERMGEIIRDPAVLAVFDRIDALGEGLQHFLKLRDHTLPDARRNRQVLQTDCEQRIKNLAPGLSWTEREQLRLPIAVVDRVTELIKGLADVRVRYEHEKAQHDDILREHQSVRDQLSHVGPVIDTAVLSQLIRKIRERGNLSEQLALLSRDITKKTVDLEQKAHQQAIFTGPIDQLATLPIPLQDTMDRFAQQWAYLEQELADTAKTLQTLSAQLQEIQRDLEALSLQGTVPILHDLWVAREQRDISWAQIKRVWLEGQADEVPNPHALADAYARQVENADRVSDDLRLDAERSARRAMLLLQQRQTQKALQDSREHQANLEEQFSALRTQWALEWTGSGIVPRNPGAMKEWLSIFYRPMIQMVTEHQHMEEARQALLTEMEMWRKELVETLDELPDSEVDTNQPLNALLTQAERYVERMNKMAAERLTLEDQEHKLADKIVQRRETMARWEREGQILKDQWQEIVSRFPSLPPRPEDAAHYTEHLRELLRQLTTLEGIDTQIRYDEEQCQGFSQEANAVAQMLGESLASTISVESWVRSVRHRLQIAREQEQLWQVSAHDAGILREEIEKAQDAVSRVVNDLTQYVSLCDVADLTALRAYVVAAQQFRELDTKGHKLEQTIRQTADGVPVEHLLGALKEMGDADKLFAQQLQLKDRSEQLQGDIERVKERLQEVKGQLASLSATQDAAATAAQDAQRYWAEVDKAWSEYLRVELARRLLARAVEQFRERNESSILRRAEHFFTRMTLGQYEGLLIEYAEQTPYLLAVHASGQRRDIHQLSDGTRDQLFLSLRLAFVEQHLEASEPLPLVMDDILVHFDDERTWATLAVLQELSQKTQILYFTHHQSVIEQIRTLPHPDGIAVYDLKACIGQTS
ncbi:AAA family ATPase [Sulfobacillus sp. hq2]|uniref:AAA family ATPase n=1 Tax=Sulfobacillus TaxID=28033 RepID=UPI000CD20B98|nr:AAA family ATPase [Sulfobacillus sp. hq2]POB11357.1 hypothetical protein CO251_05445 [Sulfobacillus sp. hq2]